MAGQVASFNSHQRPLAKIRVPWGSVTPYGDGLQLHYAMPQTVVSSSRDRVLRVWDGTKFIPALSSVRPDEIEHYPVAGDQWRAALRVFRPGCVLFNED